MPTPTIDPRPVQARFRAMGSDAHVVVVGASPALLDVARARIEALEGRWSRFRPDSEVTVLNEQAGRWVAVSPDTLHLVERATEAWRLTGGRYDPTVLGAVVAAGYDRTFEELADRHPDSDVDPAPGAISPLLLGCDDIEVDGHRVRLPARTGFDPGGIGKGLAADIVTAELLAAGADGVCVNLGGDVRVAGIGPSGGTWTVGVDHPWSDEPVARIGLVDGGVATSTTLRRRWLVDGEARHHLIDPDTGRPSTTDVNSVTVVAGQAWLAEVLAKAVLLRGSTHPFDVVDGCGADAFAVCDDGTVLSSDRLDAFLAGHPLPAQLTAPDPTADLTGRTEGARP